MGRRAKQQRRRQLDAEVEAALAALGTSAEAPAHDGWLDPAALTHALQNDDAVLLRGHRELEAADSHHAAVPRDPVWIRIGDETTIAPMRSADPTAVSPTTVRIEVERERWPDDIRGEPKQVASLWLDAGEPFLVAEALDPRAEQARAHLAPLARALADRLGLEGPATDRRAPAPAAEPLSARELARWAARREGPLLVLRDYASLGPRETALGEGIAAATMAAGAAIAWYWSYGAYQRQAYEDLAIAGAIAFVLTLAAYATFHIARHSARYRARSEALMYIAHDRFVVAPWHARDGAVDDNPEGRFGAALRLGDLEEVEVVEEGGATIRLRTAHGPYDVGTLEGAKAAERWRRALMRWAGALSQKPRPSFGAAALALLALGTIAGCHPPAPTPAPPPRPAPATTAAPTPPTEAAPAAEAEPPEPDGPAIVNNDIAAAEARARAEDKALFVEVWAPWCHTCLSMKSFVLTDPAIEALGDRVVFATIDSDRPDNADFMERYEVNVWPTLFVLEPGGEVLDLWQGAASVEELRSFIVGAVDARDAARDPDGPLTALLEAKRAHADGAWPKAASHYRRALERGGEGWSRRSEALSGLIFAERKQRHFARCARLGAEHAADVGGAAIPTDFCHSVRACTEEVVSRPLRERAREACRSRLERHTSEPPAEASVDDRADALSLLSRMRREAGDRDGAREALETQLSLLEEAAAEAPSPSAAATFDYARMRAYLALDRGEEAVAMLRDRTEQLPEAYEPHARLAEALLAVERPGEALAPIARAVELSYGPRRIRYLGMQARAHRLTGDAAGERAALEALVEAFEALPEATKPQWRDGAETARRRLSELR